MAPAFDLFPGQGLGAFQLGSTLWNVINHLRSTPSYGNIDIVWNDTQPQASYISVNVATLLRLIFSGSSQRLILIEVLPPAIPSVFYKGQPLVPALTATSHEQSSIHPQRMLNSRFGPTYAPSTHPSYPDEWLLSYPGFIFGYAKENTKAGTASRAVNIDAKVSSQQTEQDVLTRIIVSSHNPNDQNAPAFLDLQQVEDTFKVLNGLEGDISHVDIEFGKEGASTALSIRVFGGQEPASTVRIILGISTAEDLTCELGPPLRTHFKEDNRLSIHSVNASTPAFSAPAYFFNYFSLGLDFLIHPETNRVIKVILHSNTPGEVLFGRYARCRWAMSMGTGAKKITSEDSLEQVKAFFSNSDASPAVKPVGTATRNSQRTERAMVLDRVADSGDGLKLDRPTELHAFNGCICESTRNKSIETLWLV